MKKKFLAGLATGLFVIGITSICQAVPVTWTSNGHQYEVISSPSISWESARVTAQAMGNGWDLATITSLDEQNFITSLIGPVPVTGSFVEYAIGGQYLNGSWGWVTPEAFGFTYWGVGEPNGNISEPYLALDSRYQSGNWGWNDYPGGTASYVTGFVAERHTDPVPEPATMLLFGTGIAGLAAVGRRKRS